jgi:UDP-glucose 4-epimerase
LLEGLRPMIFGDGRQTRDYVFVRDIVAANLAAADAQGLVHSIFNVGTGQEVSVLELAGAVAEVGGVDPAAFQPEMRPPRAGEVLRSCLDIARARKELQLDDPTPLHDGLKATLGWLGHRQPVA